MATSREQLMAFIDGELTPGDERKVIAEIAANPDFAAYVEEQRNLRLRLAEDFAPALTQPVPERFERMILHNAPTRSAAMSNLFRQLFAPIRRRQLWIPAGAAVAGIAIGIGISGLFGAGAALHDRDGALIAGGGLARLLSTGLAGDRNPDAPGRIGLTFIDNAGDYCRTFQTSGNGGNVLAGVACHERNTWRVVATAAVKSSVNGQFRPAAASLPDSLRGAVNDMISGQPLNAAAERTARDRNWNRP